MFEVKSRIRAPSALSPDFLPRTARPAPLRDARRRSTIKLLYGPGIAFPGLARLRDIVHMVGLYNIYTDTLPPRARPAPSRPSSASGGPPAAARCGGVTNPTTEHRDAVGRSEAQLGVCIAHPGLSPPCSHRAAAPTCSRKRTTRARNRNLFTLRSTAQVLCRIKVCASVNRSS